MNPRTLLLRALPILFLLACGSDGSGGDSVSAGAALSGATRVENTSSAITYVGPWGGGWYTLNNAAYSGGSEATHMDAGARATFTFTGTAVAWIGFKDPWSGIARVYLDGAVVATVDTYAASAQYQAQIFARTSLTPGSHTIAIEATGTKNAASAGSWIGLDAFDVVTASSAAPTCSLSVSAATVPVGQPFSYTMNVSVAAASASYGGTTNGKADALSPVGGWTAGRTSLTETYTAQPGWVGAYTRQVVFKDASNAVLCTTNTVPVSIVAGGGGGATSPTTYTAYTGTDVKPMPAAPALGPANSVIVDPTFGSRILRVTDTSSLGGTSLFPADSGFVRTFNADASAIKIIDPHGFSYWLEFDAARLQVGKTLHPLSLQYQWSWSATNKDLLYMLSGKQLASYDKATGATSNLGGPSNGYPVAYSAIVIGADQWVCSSAGWHNGVVGGEGCYQDECTALYCVQPSNPASAKTIDVVNKTINGVPQTDPNWPTFGSSWASYPHIGIHSTASGVGDRWVEVDFHSCSWGGNCSSIFNLTTNTWQLIKDQTHGGDTFWAGHAVLGNGKYFNQGGAHFLNSGMGGPVRDPDAVNDASKYLFVSQPPIAGDWSNDGHYSWHNSMSNPKAPIIGSHYSAGTNGYVWSGEIVGIAVDGSNTVYRFAHSHQNDGVTGGFCFPAEAFAQVSNDGRWALFSSPWGGKLGAGNDVGCGARLDTFIVELK
jgi:hypothetical protein